MRISGFKAFCIITLIFIVSMFVAAKASAGESVLYGGLFDGTLVTVDMETAEVQVIGSTGYDKMTSLAYDSDKGVLYALVNHGWYTIKLIAIDPLTAASTLIGPVTRNGYNIFLVEGLTYNSDDGLLYASGGQQIGINMHISNWLLVVNPDTAETTKVGDISNTGDWVSGDCDALGYAEGRIYCNDTYPATNPYNQYTPRNGRMSVLDMTTGIATGVAEVEGQGLGGIAYDPASGNIYTASGTVLKRYSVVDGAMEDVGTMVLNGQTTAVSWLEVVWEKEHEVGMDIKPGSCPNPLNTKSNGVVSIAINGSPDLDVKDIDTATINIAGISPLAVSYEDVASIYEPLSGKELETDCTSAAGDGYEDLVMKFRTQEIIANVEEYLGRELLDGETLILGMEGNLLEESGGKKIVGEDILRVIDKNKNKDKQKDKKKDKGKGKHTR